MEKLGSALGGFGQRRSRITRELLRVTTTVLIHGKDVILGREDGLMVKSLLTKHASLGLGSQNSCKKRGAEVCTCNTSTERGPEPGVSRVSQV